jgi:hypothetical protein
MREFQIQFFNNDRAEVPDFKNFEVIDGSITNEYLKQKHAFVEVLRREWESISDYIDKRNDDVLIRDSDGVDFKGRIVSFTNADTKVEVELGSYEEDAKTGEPILGTVSRSQSDKQMVEEIITTDGSTNIPANFPLFKGNVEQTVNNLSFVFSNSTTAGMIRQVQGATGAFVEYDGAANELNYEKFPEGQSASITIGPAEQNISERFSIVENKRDDATHVRVLGAGDGDAQITAEEEVVSVGNNGNRLYNTYTDNSIATQSEADRVAQTLANEIQNAPIKVTVETTIFDEDINLGTPVRAVSERDGLDQEPLYATKVEKVFDGDDTLAVAKFTNRLLTDQTEGERRRAEIESLSNGIQGDIVTINSSGERDVVDSGNSYTFDMRKPSDVVEVLRAEVKVEGLEYRVPFGGVDADGNIQPGITQFGDTPSGVSLHVNGTKIADDIGTGRFTEVVDVSGELNEGFNTIEVESDTLGHVRGTGFIDVYRQITD